MSMVTRTPCDEVAAGSPRADVAPCSERVGRWVLVATILGSSMAFIDGTVVNVALPALQEALDATAADAQWVVESYALLLAALLLVGGALGDRFGRRRIFGLGVVIFTAASMACGLAPSVAWLIVARGVQGIGAALLVPGSLALISASFDGEARGKAIGTWSGFTAITAALGPVLGGWLIDNFDWRWVFFINLPLGAAVLVIVAWRVPESMNEDAPRDVDQYGALLATVGLGALVFGMVEAGRDGWTPLLAASAVGGLLALAAFVQHERRTSAPMVPPHLFANREFAGANVLTLLLYAALGGALFFLPFNLVQVQGWSATAAGAALLPFIALMFLLSRWAGGLVQRYGPRLPLVVGPLIAAVGFALLSRPGIGGSYWSTFFPGVLVLGLGMATSVAPLTTVVMESVSTRHSGIASGINNAVSRTASLLAVAVLGLVMTSTFGTALERDLRAANVPDSVRVSVLEEREQWAAVSIPSDDPAVQRTARRAVNEAFVSGYRRIMLIAAALAALSALVGGTTITRRGPGKADGGTGARERSIA